MKRLRNTLAAFFLCALLPGCGETTGADSPPTVAVSVLPLAYIVDRLAGDFVETVVMLPPGASPTQYQPTVAQLRALADASLYVKVGHPNFPFEATWLDRLLDGASGVPMVDASAGLAETGDPHVWLAPHNVAAMAAEVADALAGALPEHEAQVRANLAELEREVGALDREIRAIFESARASGRGTAFLVQHPAWGHFADAYGLEQVAVEHHHREPDPHALSERIEWARRQRLRVVFVQPQLDSTPAETVAREIGARVVELDPLAYDWAANLREVAHAVSEGLSE